MKKGFTLIELLAVIFIIGIILVIAIPTVDKAIKEARQQLYETQLNNIIAGAKNWSAKNHNILPEEDGEVITLTLGQLKIGGFVDENIKDPRTKKLFPNDLEITIKKVGNNYEFKVIEDSGGINDGLDPNSPSIVLNGSAQEIVEIYSEYVDKGVIAKDPSGTLIEDVDVVIKSNNVVVNEIDTSKLVQYKIIYTATYNGVSNSVIRTVTVKDTTPPVLTIPTNVTLEVTKIPFFDVMEGVIATDNSLKTPTIIVSGTLSPIPGIYYIKYKAIDESGNATTKIRTIIVKQAILFNESKGVNHPQLAEGMIPIKWNGTTEVVTTEDDPNWYDYSQKKWANAKTADGSYWVWIPRYAYKITSCFHSSCSGSAGNIEIKFLQGTTNKAADGSIVETSGYNFGTKDTSTHYFLHPAFTFGNDEIPGFWVAKFEPSGTENDISILPNVSSLRSMTISDQFDAAFNMRNNSKYGWSSTEVDTHMMKNTEWGAVAYLSQSEYGANEEIWINNSSTFITGCAGNSVSASYVSGCQNAYNTTTGQKASTTHNIYGVYDMSGGTWERVAAYVDNGNSYLTTNGQSIINADIKYKDVYTVGASDSSANNYEANKNKYGDAVYETSSSGNSSSGSWNSDLSYMPYSSLPWFHRGGNYSGTTAGAFNFRYSDGPANSSYSFRPVVVSITSSTS